MAKVIVFGPTGNIGSIAARAAEERGAKVVLAMRDPSKIITGLDQSTEKAGNYERVQADLTSPDTIEAAVKSTGAQRAFIYLAQGTPDNMQGTLSALKSAGIQFVVFLSSSTIQQAPDDVPQQEVIPYMHAQVEINLSKVFGPGNFVAVRPGRFATNLFRYKQGIIDGEVRLFGGDYEFDNITPEDMGTVSAELLVNGPRNGQQVVYLYAPRWMSIQDSILIIAKVLGKDVKITKIGKEDGIDEFVKVGLPRPLAEFMANMLDSGEDKEVGRNELHQTGRDNVRAYIGREPLSLEDWVAANKQLFAA